MGFYFELRFANIVAYLTDIHGSKPPRLTQDQLRAFFGSLNRDSFLSSDREWLDRINNAANEGYRYIDSLNHRPLEVLDDEIVERALFNLRLMLNDYLLFGLAVGIETEEYIFSAFVKYAMLSSEHYAIFLLPRYDRRETLEVLDPFPPISLLAAQPENWPGILFWSRTGTAAFARLSDAENLYADLRKNFREGTYAIDNVLNSFTVRGTNKKILQLSDLHLGTEEAAKNQGFLESHLHSLAPTVNRIAITGDLFDNPTEMDAAHFNNFRTRLLLTTGKDIVVIPGNHDQKFLGNSYRWVGKNLRQLADLEWSNLVIDDELQCVFFCFDSSKDADWARGKVTRDQLREVSTLFESKCATKPELRKYLALALVHHHPFSFEESRETRVQRALRFFGMTDERFLRMEDADSFLRWCARRQITLILHGHKHVQRYFTARIPIDDNGYNVREVTAVGCGTSLGAENYPMSYNIVAWDPASARWSATFYADPGDYSGFAMQKISVHQLQG